MSMSQYSESDKHAAKIVALTLFLAGATFGSLLTLLAFVLVLVLGS